MMKKRDVIYSLIKIFSVVSLIMLTFIMCICNDVSYAMHGNYTKLSMIVSLVLGTIIIRKKTMLWFKDKEHHNTILMIISVILTGYFIYQLSLVFNVKFNNNVIVTYINLSTIGCLFLRISILCLASWIVLWVIYYISFCLLFFVANEIKNVTSDEKIFFIVSMLIITLVSVIWYSRFSPNIIEDDILYSIDSNYVASNMMTRLTWSLDFRHVFFSVLLLPFQFIYSVINKVLLLPEMSYYIYLVIENGLFLVLTSIMLSKLTNSKMIKYLYMCSFPVMLFSVIIEKFQFCVFLLVLFVYARMKANEEKSVENLALIGAIGSITTSAVFGIWSNREKGMEKIKSWLYLVIVFLTVSIGLGKLGVLETVFNFLQSSSSEVSIVNRFYGLTEMLASCILAPLYVIRDGIFIWQNEANYLNILGLIIFLFCFITFFLNRKMKIAQISFSWFCFAIILFLVMNWYCNEAPLFNLYFSWAVLVLIVLGVNKIISSIRIKKIICVGSCVIMFVINGMHLIEIFKFFLSIN